MFVSKHAGHPGPCKTFSQVLNNSAGIKPTWVTRHSADSGHGKTAGSSGSGDSYTSFLRSHTTQTVFSQNMSDGKISVWATDYKKRINTVIPGRQLAQSVERRTLEVEVRGSKPAQGNWRLGRISPNQPNALYCKVTRDSLSLLDKLALGSRLTRLLLCRKQYNKTVSFDHAMKAGEDFVFRNKFYRSSEQKKKKTCLLSIFRCSVYKWKHLISMIRSTVHFGLIHRLIIISTTGN